MVTFQIPKFNFKNTKFNPKTPVQALPFIEFDQYLRMRDKTYRCILKVAPINNELLEDDENDDIVEMLQEAINSTGVRIMQFTISSERLNLDEYKEYLQQKVDTAANEYFLERLKALQEYMKETSLKQRITKTFYFTLASRYTDLERAKEEFEEATFKAAESLKASEIMVRQLGKKETWQMLYEKLNPRSSAAQPFNTELQNVQAIAPEPIRHIGDDHSIMDGMYYRFFTITNYPSEVGHSWMRKVLNTRAEVDTSIIMQPTGKKKVIDDIDKSLGFIRNRLGRPGTKESEASELKKKEKSNVELIEKLSQDNEGMFNVSMIFSVREKSLKDLDIACERLLTNISTNRMQARQLIFMANEAFWLTMPLAYNSSYLQNPNMYWPMQTSAVASILPFDSTDFLMSKGVLKGKNPNTQSTIIVDRRHPTRVDNPNEVVIAPSGRGKSWYAKADVSRENAQGTKCIIIDPEREYKFKFGERVVFSMGSKYCTNPFHIRSAIIDIDIEEGKEEDYIEDVGQYLQRKIADMIPFFRFIYKTMDSTEENELTEAIRQTYLQYGPNKEYSLDFKSKELPGVYPTLAELDVVLKRPEFAETLQNFRRNLRPYVKGIYANMFNGQTNWTMDTMLTVLDIHSLSEVVQPQMMYLLVQDIWEYIKIDRNEKKGLYVDEAWKLASPDNPQTLKFLFELAKRIRKYGGYLTTITQNVTDFFGATSGAQNYGQAIFDNAYFKMFLGLSENDYQKLKDIDFRFSRKEERILKKNKSKGRGVFMAGSTRMEIQTAPLIDELRFIDPAEFTRLQNLEERSLGSEYKSASGFY